MYMCVGGEGGETEGEKGKEKENKIREIENKLLPRKHNEHI